MILGFDNAKITYRRAKLRDDLPHEHVIFVAYYV